MCIAILKLKDSVITDEALKNSFENNPDGAGIAYVSEGKVIYQKGIFDEDRFVEAVRQAEKITEGPMLIHCRIGTSGPNDFNNSHPHVVNSNSVLIHNGILDIDIPKDSKDSDTVLFIQKYMQHLPEDFIYNESIVNMLECMIGNGNKFCILNANGDYIIVNEKAGHWKDGVWYSNDSYSYSYNYSGWGTSYNIKLNKKDRRNLFYQIEKLTPDMLEALGDYPCYDLITKKIVPDSRFSTCPYLDEIDEEAYDYYDQLRAYYLSSMEFETDETEVA